MRDSAKASLYVLRNEMSQTGQTSAPNLTEGFHVTNLTLVVLLLIPCVVILLLLNCLFLAYKFLYLSKRGGGRKRGDPEELLLLRSSLQRGWHRAAFPPLQDGRSRAYTSLSEPVLPHPVTSSRASSRERPIGGLDQRIRLLRPDGATGSGYPRAPSTIRVTSSSPAVFTPRLDLQSGWCQSLPVLPQSTVSEGETRVNLVPPNSLVQEEEHIHQSSTYEMLTDVNPAAAVRAFDKADMECEFSILPSETSAGGPGLDSDFGASAGVSLRILSADSDGLSNGVLPSALEWDYYDPCYVKQNNVPKQKHHRPAVHTKQYWV